MFENTTRGTLLPQSFFSRDALIVARELLGSTLCLGNLVLMICETEAYRWPNDSASHCYRGQTARNAPMFGPAGYAYIYLCYGIHNMANVVTNQKGEGAGVLIRACDQILDPDFHQTPILLDGPGKVGKALQIDRSWSGHPFFNAGGLELRKGREVANIISGPRIGIDYANPDDRSAAYRFAIADSPSVTHRNRLNNIYG